MNNDVQITGKRHYQKSVDGFNQLPDVFTKDDVMKCFGYDKTRAADKKIERLVANSYIIKIKEGDHVGKFKKLQNTIV
jgi:hypothetical protein